MRQVIEKGRINSNRYTQLDGALSISYGFVGHIHIFVEPPNAEDSMAFHNYLILYHTYDAKNITNKRIGKCVKKFIHYQRVTCVL